jgi:hypothetical protein
MEIEQWKFDIKCLRCHFHTVANAYIDSDGICNYCREKENTARRYADQKTPEYLKTNSLLNSMDPVFN